MKSRQTRKDMRTRRGHQKTSGNVQFL